MILRAIIERAFNATIWRMEIDELTATLFVELRNNEDKDVSFTAINLSDGTIYFTNLKTDERWLTGIEIAYNGVLLLHFFETTTGPTHKGLLAIDAVTGKTLWTNYNLALDHLSANGPVVYDTRILPRKLLSVIIKTGQTVTNNTDFNNDALKSKILLPELMDPEDLPFKLPNKQPYGNMVHYLEYNNFRIVSLHTLNAGNLVQSLLIFDGIDQVYEDLLNTGIQKIQPEAFIMYKNRLIYIKNKSELKVLPL